MKSLFNLEVNLLKLEEELENKKDILAISLSSTGLNDRKETEHRPVKLDAVLYKYNHNENIYLEEFTFSRMVECSDTALSKAIEVADNGGYDVFFHNGIDREKYIAKENVLSVSDFKNEIIRFGQSIDPNNTVVVVNDTKFTKDMLATIDCNSFISNLDNGNNNIIDAIEITRDIFKRNEVSSSLVNMNGGEKLTASLNNGLLYAKGCLDGHHKGFSIIGGNEKCKAIYEICSAYGREKGILLPEREEYFKRDDIERMHSLQLLGKENYNKLSVADKIEYHITKGYLSADVIDRNHPCDLNNLLDALENPNIKGFSFLQVSTSGFGAGDIPIQIGFSVLTKNNDTGLAYAKENGTTVRNYYDINTSDKVKKQMLSESYKSYKPFDAFDYAGIDKEKYNNGITTNISANSTVEKKLLKAEDVALLLRNHFKKYPIDKYPIITLGKADENDKEFSEYSYTGKALSKICNISECSMTRPHFIDFSQALKEYTFASYVNRPDIKENILLKNIEKSTNFNFSLDYLASEKNEPINHAMKRVMLMAESVYKINRQHSEIIKSYGSLDALNQKISEHTSDFKNRKVNENGVPNLDIERERELSLREEERKRLENEIAPQVTEKVAEEPAQQIQEEQTAISNEFNLFGKKAEYFPVDFEKEKYKGYILVDSSVAENIFLMSSLNNNKELTNNVLNALNENIFPEKEQDKLRIPILNDDTISELKHLINGAEYNFNILTNGIVADTVFVLYNESGTYNDKDIIELSDTIRRGENSLSIYENIFSPVTELNENTQIADEETVEKTHSAEAENKSSSEIISNDIQEKNNENSENISETNSENEITDSHSENVTETNLEENNAKKAIHAFPIDRPSLLNLNRYKQHVLAEEEQIIEPVHEEENKHFEENSQIDEPSVPVENELKSEEYNQYTFDDEINNQNSIDSKPEKDEVSHDATQTENSDNTQSFKLPFGNKSENENTDKFKRMMFVVEEALNEKEETTKESHKQEYTHNTDVQKESTNKSDSNTAPSSASLDEEAKAVIEKLNSKMDKVIEENSKLLEQNNALIQKQIADEERIDKLIQAIDLSTKQNMELMELNKKAMEQNRILTENIKDVTANLVQAYSTSNDAHLKIIQELAIQKAEMELSVQNTNIVTKANEHTNQTVNVHEKALDTVNMQSNKPLNVDEENIANFIDTLYQQKGKEGIVNILYALQDVAYDNDIQISAPLGQIVLDLNNNQKDIPSVQLMQNKE